MISRKKAGGILSLFIFILIGLSLSLRTTPLPAIALPDISAVFPNTSDTLTVLSIPTDLPYNAQESIATASVTRVIDGDTIDVDIVGKTTRVRLIGVDTPEVVDPRKPVQCYGKEASSYVKNILTGQMVTLENDRSQEDTDKYGRILRYVYLKDGQLLNKKLIAEGYAHEYTYRIPYRFQKEFQAAEKAAAKAKAGLWGDGVCTSQTIK